MNILYHWPNPDTIYAGRTIAYGYRHAYSHLGHNFQFLTPQRSQHELLITHRPDIFITSLSSLSLRFLDLSLLKLARRNGTKVFVNVPFWQSPLSRWRVTESPSIADMPERITLMASGCYGDIYFNACEQGDPRMEGFAKVIGYQPRTLLLAADALVLFPHFEAAFQADLSFVGTCLPEKRHFFDDVFFPCAKRHRVRAFGQDWTPWERMVGLLQRTGQYYNLPVLKRLQKPPLLLADEQKIYSSSLISVNVHEGYQRQYGDLNERTFKIPLAGGFEIIDAVLTITKYFLEDKEIVVAHSDADWREKIEHYLANPEKRGPIIQAGRQRVLKEHTYHHRVATMLQWYGELQ